MNSEADEDMMEETCLYVIYTSTCCPALPCLSTRGHATGRLDSGKVVWTDIHLPDQTMHNCGSEAFLCSLSAVPRLLVVVLFISEYRILGYKEGSGACAALPHTWKR